MLQHNYYKIIAIIYVFTLHVFLAALIVKSDFIPSLYAKFRTALGSQSGYSQKMLQYHKWMDESVPNGAIIFLGDSITQGLATAAVAPHSINYGIGGENTEELLQAIPLYRSLDRSGGIVLTIGINDLTQGVSAGLNDRYKKIIAALPQKQPLLWNAVMPARGRNLHQIDIINANKNIKLLCEGRVNCTFLDTWAFLADSDGHMDNTFFLDDGVHLNSEGYRAWIRALSQAIQHISAAKHNLSSQGTIRDYPSVEVH